MRGNNMKELIFGSVAAKYWFPDFREPKDLDYMSQQGRKERSEQHYWWPTFQEISEKNKDSKYADPEFLLTIKMAHSRWDIHWEKTAADILFFLNKGAKPDEEIYKKLIKDFQETHGKRWVSFKGKDSETFFQDAVERKYNHDDIHAAIAYYDKPLYEKILKEPESKSVACSKIKFDKLSEGDKVLLVKEEVFVTALERYLIPNNFKYSQNLAYHKSLKKLLTSMAESGWFCRWMIFNYNLLAKNNDWTFISKFKQKFNYD